MKKLLLVLVSLGLFNLMTSCDPLTLTEDDEQTTYAIGHDEVGDPDEDEDEETN